MNLFAYILKQITNYIHTIIKFIQNVCRKCP